MAINVQNINKKPGNLLRTSKNLKQLSGNTQRLTGEKLALEHDVCCGLGRKTIYFVGQNGVTKRITKYPVIYNNQIVNNPKELGEQITKLLGVGYIAYVINAGNAEVLAAPYLKKSDGTLDIADFVTIQNT